jgi:hypothetical protein
LPNIEKELILKLRIKNIFLNKTFSFLFLKRSERPRYGYNPNRGLTPPLSNRFGGNRDSLPPDSNYRHGYNDLSTSLGYKRPAYMDNNYYAGSGYGYNESNVHDGPPSRDYYENVHASKKSRRDW